MDKLELLENELKKYQQKLTQMQHDWSASKGDSHYGNEYLETQIKVYWAMIVQLKSEIAQLKRK